MARGRGRMRMTMSTRNLSGLQARFRAFDAEYQQQVRKVNVAGAVTTYDLARKYMAYDTGFMHDHLRIKITDKGLGYEVGWEEADFFAEGHPFYPVWVEHGTLAMAAQPALFPANEAVRPIVRQNHRAALAASIARSNRRRAA